MSERYYLMLEAVKDRFDRDPTTRLRRGLKHLLRAEALRCVDIRTMPVLSPVGELCHRCHKSIGEVEPGKAVFVFGKRGQCLGKICPGCAAKVQLSRQSETSEGSGKPRQTNAKPRSGDQGNHGGFENQNAPALQPAAGSSIGSNAASSPPAALSLPEMSPSESPLYPLRVSEMPQNTKENHR
jgi:hypothetical protein